jgi:hypothetical protein
MTIETFYTLCDWLLANTSLKSSRKAGGVAIEEKFVIFLYVTAHTVCLCVPRRTLSRDESIVLES